MALLTKPLILVAPFLEGCMNHIKVLITNLQERGIVIRDDVMTTGAFDKSRSKMGISQISHINDTQTNIWRTTLEQTIFE